MSVKVAYSRGFEKGLEEAAVKLAAAYGIEKTALIDDIKGMVGLGAEKPMFSGADQGLAGGAAGAAGLGEGQPMFSGADLGLAGGAAGAAGLGFGADALGKAQGRLAKNIIDETNLAKAALGRSTRNAARSADATSKMLESMARRGIIERGTEADKLLRDAINYNAQAEKAMGISKTHANEAARLKGSRGGRALEKGFNAKNLGRAGTALKGLGALGGATLLGKKLYDVVTD